MRFGLRRRLRSGIRLKIYPTFKCNLRCDYCGNRLGVGFKPDEKNLKFNMDQWEWMEYITTFPVKVKQVDLSGGEPTIWKGFTQLCNWLLSNDYLVMVYTNLSNLKLLDVIRSDRLYVYTTYHKPHITRNKFMHHYNRIAKRHRVHVNEIGYRDLKVTNVVHPWGCSLDQAKKPSNNCLYIAADGTIFRNCFELIRHCHA